MRTKSRLSMWVLLPLVLSACGLFQSGDERVITGSGQVTSETRVVSGITAIALEGLGDVVVQQGATEGLVIEGEDNLLPLITSTVENGTLRLGFDRATWRDTIRPTEPIRFVLSIRDLQAFDLSGTGSLQAGSLQSDHLVLRLSGTGDMSLEHLDGSQLEIHIDGTGTVNAAGTINDLVVDIPGSGQVQAGDLDSQTARVALSGTGDVIVWARNELSMNISGTGTISYWGDPTVSRRDITGTGDINPMGVK
jgi:hypothetical protein